MNESTTNPTTAKYEYTLGHSNVDGAGIIGQFPSLNAAKAEANRRQSTSDANGNPWGYTYWVAGYNRFLYRTHRAASS